MKILNTESLPVSTAHQVTSKKLHNSVIQSLHLTPNSDTQVKTINMRNVSLNEINALIRAGVDGLLDIAPAVSSQLNNPYETGSAANIKVDFISQIEATIEFQKSRGENVDFLNHVLANIKSIDGMKMPTGINTVA
jgi:hypothetical protein